MAAEDIVIGGHEPRPPPDPADAGELPAPPELLRISDAVLRANYIDEALEAIAEHALVQLKASSVSISRWERRHNHVRTLINVGVLGAGEERLPASEVYPV